MTPLISLSNDGKNLTFADALGVITEIDIETTNGAILSSSNGEIDAVDAGSTAPTGTPTVVKAASSTERWMINYFSDEDTVMLVGADDFDMGLKTQEHIFKLDGAHHIKKSGNDLVITPA